MTVTGALLLASACLYAGFQWTIRVLVYPQFATVSAENFVAYERKHQRLVSIVVGPLFAFLGGSAVAAVIVEPSLASVAAACCVGLILLVTALAAVPQHRQLATGFDPATHRRLLRIDTARLVLAVFACVAAAAVVIGE